MILSQRLEVIGVAECPTTFGVSRELVTGIIAELRDRMLVFLLDIKFE